jgi:hypothetical protein
MYNTAKLNISPCSQRVPEEFPKSSRRVPPKSSQRVPTEFPQSASCSKKERPQTLYHVHYVCTRVVTTFGRGDSCPKLVYSATFVALLRHLVSSSGECYNTHLHGAWRDGRSQWYSWRVQWGSKQWGCSRCMMWLCPYAHRSRQRKTQAHEQSRHSLEPSLPNESPHACAWARQFRQLARPCQTHCCSSSKPTDIHTPMLSRSTPLCCRRL